MATLFSEYGVLFPPNAPRVLTLEAVRSVSQTCLSDGAETQVISHLLHCNQVIDDYVCVWCESGFKVKCSTKNLECPKCGRKSLAGLSVYGSTSPALRIPHSEKLFLVVRLRSQALSDLRLAEFYTAVCAAGQPLVAICKAIGNKGTCVCFSDHPFWHQPEGRQALNNSGWYFPEGTFPVSVGGAG